MTTQRRFGIHGVLNYKQIEDYSYDSPKNAYDKMEELLQKGFSVDFWDRTLPIGDRMVAFTYNGQIVWHNNTPLKNEILFS
jgi:hypothetical protein